MTTLATPQPAPGHPGDDDLDDSIEDGLDAALFAFDADSAALDTMDDVANRLLFRLRRNESEVARVRAQGQRERDRIDRWEHARVGVVARATDHLYQLLDGLARAYHARAGVITLKLSNGTLKLRPGQPSLVCSDPAAFWQWAHEERHPKWASYEVVYRPDAKLRHHLKPGRVLGPSIDPRTQEPIPDLFDHDAVDPDTGAVVPFVILRIAERRKFSLTTAGPLE